MNPEYITCFEDILYLELTLGSKSFICKSSSERTDMILGLDHLTYNAENTQQAIQVFTMQDYECEFIETNVRNHSNKKRILKRYQPSHEIAFMRSKTREISVEITNHGKCYKESTGPYSFKNGIIQAFTPNLSEDKNFFLSALGFVELDNNQMELKTFLPHWSCKIQFNAVKSKSLCMMDSSGFTCLAFWSNDIKQDEYKIKTFGTFDFTDSFILEVNQKPLEIILFRTPSGLLCELIQPRK